MNGMRVKLTWTLSGGGTSAPWLITVTGFNDREMQTTCDMLVLEVPGLCVGGYGVGGNEQVDYIVFNKNGHNKERFVLLEECALTIYQLSG